MKIVCIRSKDYLEEKYEYPYLTFGKCYHIIPNHYNMISPIINDIGHMEWYYREDFMTLEEWRDEQLKKLLYE